MIETLLAPENTAKYQKRISASSTDRASGLNDGALSARSNASRSSSIRRKHRLRK